MASSIMKDNIIFFINITPGTLSGPPCTGGMPSAAIYCIGNTSRSPFSPMKKVIFFRDRWSWTSVFAPADDKIWLGGVFWDGQNIYVGTDNGLLVSQNGGASFFIENHPGLPAGTGIYHLAGAKSGSTVRLFFIPAPASEY